MNTTETEKTRETLQAEVQALRAKLAMLERTEEQSAARLRKAEARFRNLVEEIPAVTFMAPLDEGVGELYVSPQIEALLGFSQKEWVEDPVLWYRQLHPDDRERWNTEFAPTCAEGQAFSSVYRFVARDGRVVWVRGEAKVVKDDDGRPLFLQGIAFDITAIKEAEAEQISLNQTLEQRVAERTQELTRSNAALEQFNFFVAHEVRKPLGHMLLDAQEPAKPARAKADRGAEKPLEGIVRKIKDLDLMIDRMLQYARFGGGKLKFRPTDCATVFRAARDKLQDDIKDAGAVVTAGRLPTVLGDQTHLLLVFENLIGNAIKYRARKRALKVRVGASAGDGEWLFWVKDNGMAIEPDSLERIFVLFKRNVGEEIPGHGIGLAFCRKVIEHHGGRIWVESKQGKGSTFFFTLPALPHPAETPADARNTPGGQ
jgi:PAS domain S-box-containing protein